MAKAKNESELEERIERLRVVLKHQKKNTHCDDYMHGMTNGLILALSILMDQEPIFVKKRKKASRGRVPVPF